MKKRMRSLARIFVVALGAILIALSARAADRAQSGSNMTVRKMETIVVTAKRAPQPVEPVKMGTIVVIAKRQANGLRPVSGSRGW